MEFRRSSRRVPGCTSKNRYEFDTRSLLYCSVICNRLILQHDLCPAVSDIDFMISLLYYYILCMVRQTTLVYLYLLRYSYVCSSMMSVHPKGGGSVWDTRVSLTSVDMVSRLAKCC